VPNLALYLIMVGLRSASGVVSSLRCGAGALRDLVRESPVCTRLSLTAIFVICSRLRGSSDVSYIASYPDSTQPGRSGSVWLQDEGRGIDLRLGPDVGARQPEQDRNLPRLETAAAVRPGVGKPV
jgi:hypothetical protein